MADKFNVMELQNLELRLGYAFQNIALLDQALTHRSYGSVHNERLEYLGDSILGMVIAKDLYDRFPKCPEGDLTRMRPGELKTGGFRRDSLIADAVESIIGAMFIDTNEDFAHVRQIVLKWFASRLETIKPDVNQKDHKSTLQELLQSMHKPLPVYKVENIKGSDNDQIFVVSATVTGVPAMTGEGPSRRKAEQKAAGLVLEYLKEHSKK